MLDGGTGSAERMVVSALRTCDWMTISELALACGSPQRSILRVLGRLSSAGRIRRFSEDRRYPSSNPMGAMVAREYRYRLIF
jgi:hypothetical protein